MKAKKSDTFITLRMSHAEYEILTTGLFEYCETLHNCENQAEYEQYDKFYMALTKKVLLCDRRKNGARVLG